MQLKLTEISQFITFLKETINNRDIVVLLRGDLASGKTTLVKNFVASLDIDEIVTSPTFSVQSIYGNSIYHYDVYNKTLGEFVALGLLEEFEKTGIHFVEWGDKKLENILTEYGFEVVVVNIEKKEESREYIIES
jgi:tRNA threonylcarbamoyladenosine biosynthesis protein TsaE